MVIFFMKILITGAAGGIAYLTALTLAERKHMVYLTCHTKNQVKTVKEKLVNIKNIIDFIEYFKYIKIGKATIVITKDITSNILEKSPITLFFL